MSKSPLIASTDRPEKLSLEFSKESFSDFVHSLMTTPRLERKVTIGGFDLKLQDLKVIVDKIAHKISTAHDNIHSDFVADIEFEDGASLSLSSYEHLFSVDETRDETVRTVNVTISTVIR